MHYAQALPAIGRLFGGYDHTTVLHGFRKHCEKIGVEPIRTKDIPRCPHCGERI